MSENLENQNVSESQNVQETEPSGEKLETNSVEENNQVEGDAKTEEESNSVEKFISLLKDVATKREELQQDLINRREYLNKVVPQYEKYFQNESFKNLYSELFNHIGSKLDMEKFIPLLDNYVEARIEAKKRESLAKKENDKATDGISFEKGESKKAEKKLKMQDIPLEELESYIAKYV